MRSLLLAISFVLAGCNTFDFLSPTVVQGVVLGVELSDGQTSIGDGPVLGAVFLAEATSIRDVSANLVTDPDSIALSSQGDVAPLESAGDGLFVTGENAITALTWTVGEYVEVEMVLDGESNTGAVVAPAGPMITGIPQAVHLDQIPTDWIGLTKADIAQLIQTQADAAEFHPPNTPVTVDLTAEDYEYWVVVVYDQDGNLTYDNMPRESEELIDWVLDSEPIDSIEIPGSAFPDANSLYAVGVAGVVFADTKDYDGFNWLISNLGAGTLTVTPLVTGS